MSSKLSETKPSRHIQYSTVFWIFLIFFTSCFYIDSSPFIHFVQRFLVTSHGKQGFDSFWHSFGFYVVKGWHFTEYFILYLLTFKLIKYKLKLNKNQLLIITLLLVSLFAASDEWHQTFVPGRDGCLRDVLIDISGAGTAAVYLFSIVCGKNKI